MAANLAVIGWFKYSLFLYLVATNGANPPDFLKGIVLPLGISFFTFQQISYLVNVWRGHEQPARLETHAFIVLFFPHLIAGPIVLYENIAWQVRRRPRLAGYLAASFKIGLLIFAVGLFKKVVVADSLAPHVNDIFKFAARQDYDLSIRDAWIGALSYTLQLYFDFSGYSDMAIGLGRMFGFRLPTNFNSPYKATSIIDFWRRWHITLSLFFRNYVYIPLGGNRKGVTAQLSFVMLVFFLTGLWHGAGWTFIAWGLLPVSYTHLDVYKRQALGCAQLERLDQYVSAKRNLARRYQQAFEHDPDICFIGEPAGCKSNYWLSTIALRNPSPELRDSILAITNDSGLMVRPAWTLLNRLPMYQNCPAASLSVAEHLEASLINLPSGRCV